MAWDPYYVLMAEDKRHLNGVLAQAGQNPALSPATTYREHSPTQRDSLLSSSFLRLIAVKRPRYNLFLTFCKKKRRLFCSSTSESIVVHGPVSNKSGIDSQLSPAFGPTCCLLMPYLIDLILRNHSSFVIPGLQCSLGARWDAIS